MNDRQDNPTDPPAGAEGLDSDNPRVESLLRGWGVAESASEIRAVPPLPAEQAPTPARGGLLLLRWAPLAAAAALLIAAVGVFLARPAPSGRDPGDTAETEQLRARLAEARQDLDTLGDKLKAAEAVAGERDAARDKLRQALADLSAERQAHADDWAQWQKREGELVGEIASLREVKPPASGDPAELATLKKRLGDRETELADVRKRLTAAAKELARVQGRTAAAGGELANLRRLHTDALAEASKARDEALTLKTRQRTMFAEFQRAYLGAAGLGQPGLGGRQQAARAGRMVARCWELRPSVRSEETRQLFDTLEVILTRLELMDPMNLPAGAGFRKLLGPKLIARIDKALSARESAPVRAWLTEAKLVLSGAERVG